MRKLLSLSQAPHLCAHASAGERQGDNHLTQLSLRHDRQNGSNTTNLCLHTTQILQVCNSKHPFSHLTHPFENSACMQICAAASYTCLYSVCTDATFHPYSALAWPSTPGRNAPRLPCSHDVQSTQSILLHTLPSGGDKCTAWVANFLYTSAGAGQTYNITVQTLEAASTGRTHSASVVAHARLRQSSPRKLGMSKEAQPQRNRQLICSLAIHPT